MLTKKLENKDLTNSQPVGIFDSGMGGLNVVNAIKKLLPQQNLIYIGDTAHCPWGDKSNYHINLYSKKLTKFLIERNCKIIVIACNTASSIALPELNQNFTEVTLLDIIEPTLAYLKTIDLTRFNDIGIIGTKQTIYSNKYQAAIQVLMDQNIDHAPKCNIKALATPLLVPLIEEGWSNHAVNKVIITGYLNNLNLTDHSLLILGCTHYPLILQMIQDYYLALGKNITIVDPAELMAAKLQNFLRATDHLNINTEFSIYSNQSLEHSKFYFTENSRQFVQIAANLFPDLRLQYLSLWEQ